MARTPILLLALAATILELASTSASVPSNRPAGSAAATPTPPERVHGPDSAFETRIAGLLAAAQVPGLSVAIVGEGRVRWSGAYGLRTLDPGEPVREDTVFEAASLSKPVFAYLVMRLVERGVLDLDEPVAAHMPSYPRLAAESRYLRITPRLLLSHQAGLPNWGGDPLEMVLDPGIGFRYSGEGYVLLQRLVERVTGRGLEELARAEVFGPLGMGSSSYLWREGFAARAADGHDRLGRARTLRRVDEANAAHSLLTTAADFGRFLAAVLEGRGLGPERLQEMLTAGIAMRGDELASPRPRDLWERIGWGLGWGVQRSTDRPIVWHWGDNGAFRSFVAGDPQTGDGIVLLTNSENGLSIAAEVVRPVVGEMRWTTEWLGYEAYGAPRERALRALRTAFLEAGAAAGVESYERLRREIGDAADADLVARAAGDLVELDRTQGASRLLEAALRHHPAAARLHAELGKLRVAAADPRAAAASFARATELDPDDRELSDLAAWNQELLAAREQAVGLPEARLRALAGSYGPRQVTFEQSTLYYQREGRPRYSLVPLSDHLFALEGVADFRLRFVDDGNGEPLEIVGEYAGGGSDVTPRDAAP